MSQLIMALSPNYRTFVTALYRVAGIFGILPASPQRIFDAITERISKLLDFLTKSGVNTTEIEGASSAIINIIEKAKLDKKIHQEVADAVIIHVKSILYTCGIERQSLEKELTDLPRDRDVFERELRNLARIMQLDSRPIGDSLAAAVVEGCYPEERSINDTGNFVDAVERVYTKQQIQARRDAVRRMGFDGAPADGIKKYRGKKLDGDATGFFLEQYREYIENGYEVIFANDLSKIDPKLLMAIRNECRGSPKKQPLGTESDLVRALVENRFEDGKNTGARIATAHWRNKSSLRRHVE